MKSFFAADAPRFDNETVTGYFSLASLAVRQKRDGGQYLVILLADKTGQLEARMWDEFADVVNSCSEGCYVKVQGQIAKYNGRYQITLQRMRTADDEEIEPSDFVPVSRFPVAAMDEELRGYIAAFQNPWLQRLMLRFLDDPEIGPAFRIAPAAKRLHHAWIGGLLEHVLFLVRLCRAVAPFYPEANGDLLVAGAILHDIGKVKELSWRKSFDYTLEGQLIGHISIGQRMLTEQIAAMDTEARADGQEPFPGSLRLLLEHMLLAHHGKYEYGSPKLPMTPEALLLSTLDDLEAKFQTMRGEFTVASDAGRSAEQMTDWVRSMDRPLFDSARYLQQFAPPAIAAKEETPPAVEAPEASRGREDVAELTLRLQD